MNDSINEMFDSYEDERIQYTDSTYDIVSKVAYLIGVPLRVFENPHEPPKMELYMVLNKDKNARIIRHLSILRTSIERGFGHISEKMKYQYKSIFNMPEHIPQESIDQLAADGINFYKKTSTKLVHHIIEINRLISDRVNNCKNLFPLWINWKYIRDMLVMPNGLSEEGTKQAVLPYFENMDRYPYRIYINWIPDDNGNILFNDKKFVTLLYQQHNDYFTEYNRVSDAGSFVKSSVHDFIDDAEKVIMAVDCENSDPYRLCATLKGLDQDVIRKIQKIMLFDDVNTVHAWRILESHTSIPIEHIMTERVKRTKSLVDIELTATTCMEHYKNHVDSFIIVSSDSDYWGLISSLPDARFLVMIEREKCGSDMKAAMANSGIFYCYIDDFFSGNSEDIKKNALFTELYKHLDKAIKLNAYEMLEAALTATRIEMTPAAKRQFFDRHIKRMNLVMDDAGNISIELMCK